MAKQSLFIILLFLLLVKSFVPIGFMPSSNLALNPIVICSGIEEKIIFVDQDGNQTDQSHHDNSICEFALSSIFQMPQAYSNAFEITILNLQFSASSEFFQLTKAHGLYEARAPPIMNV